MGLCKLSYGQLDYTTYELQKTAETALKQKKYKDAEKHYLKYQKKASNEAFLLDSSIGLIKTYMGMSLKESKSENVKSLYKKADAVLKSFITKLEMISTSDGLKLKPSQSGKIQLAYWRGRVDLSFASKLLSLKDSSYKDKIQASIKDFQVTLELIKKANDVIKSNHQKYLIQSNQYIAQAYLNLNDYKNAEKTYMEMMKLDSKLSTHRVAQKGLITIYRKTKDWTRLEQNYDKWIKETKSEALKFDLHIARIDGYIEQNKFEEAWNLLDRNQLMNKKEKLYAEYLTMYKLANGLKMQFKESSYSHAITLFRFLLDQSIKKFQ